MALNTERIRNPEMKKWANDHLNRVARVVKFGAPVVDDVDLLVTTANMKVGAYTIAAQPDIPRTLSVSHTAVGAADTLGKITFVGTNYAGETITEDVSVVSGTIAYSTKAFKTVTSATGSGWVIGEGNDTITIGVGPKLGLPFIISATTDVYYGILGVALIAPTVTAGGTLSTSTVDISSGTYNGSKLAFCAVVE